MEGEKHLSKDESWLNKTMVAARNSNLMCQKCPRVGLTNTEPLNNIVVEESDVLRWFWLKSGNHIMVNQRVFVEDADGKEQR